MPVTKAYAGKARKLATLEFDRERKTMERDLHGPPGQQWQPGAHVGEVFQGPEPAAGQGGCRVRAAALHPGGLGIWGLGVLLGRLMELP